MDRQTLFSTLSDFLQGNAKLDYPELEVSIVQLDPLRITDDGKYFMELSSKGEMTYLDLAEEIENQVGDDPTAYKLVLVKWHYEFRRVPNSQEYYFDIACRDFRLIKSAKKVKSLGTLKRIAEVKEIQRLYELKKAMVASQNAIKAEKSVSVSRKSHSPLKTTPIKPESTSKKASARKSETTSVTAGSKTLPRAVKRVYKSSFLFIKIPSIQ